MIKAIIFDMDGLLIDSEPLWEEAELATFSAVGVPLTEEMTKETMGLRVDEVVQHWFSRYPWKTPTQKEVEATIVEKVIELVNEKGIAKDGVEAIVKTFKKAGLPMAIASSSQTEIINAVLDKLGIKDYFKVIHSAEHETYGKPHPGVYITTAVKLGIPPQNCLAFEDSPNGVLAAKAARMKCVAVPDIKMKDDKRLLIADMVITSLNDFHLEALKQF
ncbi:hexitol phosphatase HxpB [Candidatus Curtissbacteria bacterium]|nr:hexitol phosphatase HxpB [Candidatus Curtissbacteria bacterium]